MSTRFEVVHGNPSDEELAVVVSLLTAAASASTESPAEPVTSNWARPALRGTPSPGPGAWWRSGMPQP
ncbi:MAG: acyl-CoA carboxylase subunit epsilon [Candidatus Nanopelagicales bacterium]|nr:acyl-CoA carboxylase subunit epsilon [Candidatus Nanopelagicales bacterium]MCU0297486.1 acyl-CoA carboxylase subunit epsilon [Candidatus Nanopelagicales bacterium]